MRMRTNRWRSWLRLISVVLVPAACGARAGEPAAVDDDALRFGDHAAWGDATDRILRKDTLVRATPNDVWHAWTTSEGLARFFTPDSKVELRISGPYELYMGMTAPDESGLRGSEGCRLLSYIPREMLAFEWNFPPAVMSLRKSGARTQVVLRFTELPDGSVKVRLAQLGWQAGPEWDAGYAYFDRAWTNVLKNLSAEIKPGAPVTYPVGADEAVGRSWQDGHVEVTAYQVPEKRQVFDVTIPAPVERVWNLLATSAGLARLGGQDPVVELRPGGRYALRPDCSDRVLAYLPLEMLSTTGSAPAEHSTEDRGGTWSAYFFEPRTDGRTDLRFVVVGWRTGEEQSDRAFEYFLAANAKFLNRVYEQAVKDAKQAP